MTVIDRDWQPCEATLSVSTPGRRTVEFVCPLALDHPGEHDWQERE